MTNIRPAAVAGTFYPSDPETLRGMVRRFIDEAPSSASVPTALIAPHAGYIYSGPIAGAAYRCLRDSQALFERVVLIGPAHRVPVTGIATASVAAFATPLGEVPVDRLAVAEVLQLPQVHALNAAHREEHGLEVHLPFLQLLHDDFTIVPLLVGDADIQTVGNVFQLLASPRTLLLVSSDLSHYHDYRTARRLDQETAAAIEALEPLYPGQACGQRAINGLLWLARQSGWHAETLDLRSSGDTAGPRDQVVGYGAFLFSKN